MPVPMSSSFSHCCAKLDPENNSFSFTQLLMNGDAWHDIDPDSARIPSVLPQSDFVVNPPNAADECVIRVPQRVASTKDKKRKAPAAATKDKDMSCITTSPVAKASEADDHNPGNSSKKQKSQHKDERPKAEPVRSGNTENKGSKQGKENSKPSEAPKQDYIHVRARRGQATDSHSLAERVRREKISERMKLLQDLVPGCSKVTGKAMMLDEIINYVQSLQRQVEFLSMKLASVKPRLDLYHNTYLVNEVLPGQQQEAQALNGLLHDSHPQVWTTSCNTQIVENCS